MKTNQTILNHRSMLDVRRWMFRLTLFLLSSASASAAVRYVDVNSASPTPPYTNWATAARVIQDAVDSAALGDTVLVTNGVYATGGRLVGTNLLFNRVVVEKPIRLESVNGPGVTVIKGARAPAGDEHGNGNLAVRCVYLALTNATLSGFTLTNGHTRTTGDWERELSGGGVLAGFNGQMGGLLMNCIITGNSAYAGGGTFGGTLHNCTLTGNSAQSGGGAWNSALYNCTVTGNLATDYGGGAYAGTLHNCIVYFNRSQDGANHSYCAFEYSCTTPLPTDGVGNISADPQLVTATHLSAASPCRGAGSALFSFGVDIDGEPWANPPSMGADELVPGNVTGLLSMSITAGYTNFAAGYSVMFVAQNTGPITQSVWNFGDGTVMTNQPFASHAWTTPGTYTVKLTGYNDSHPEGVSTTVVVEVVVALHYVNAANPTPTPPYASWTTAATNIQAAIEAGTTVGRLVLVTNGVYQAGMVEANGTNRVVLTGTVRVRSVNGPEFTVIDGGGKMRCAYVSNDAVLSGFTLTNGWASGDWPKSLGGGVHCGLDGVVTNCMITGNSAQSGGGVYRGTLYNCTLTGNSVEGGGGGAYQSTLYNCTLMGNRSTRNEYYSYFEGGGAWASTLNNCIISGNSAPSGGGVSGGILYNCTLTGNSAENGGGAFGDYYSGTPCILYNCTVTGNSAEYGGGAYGGTLYNCIAYFNQARSGPNQLNSTFFYSCTTPLPTDGVGNIAADPQLVTATHLSPASPCRGAGSAQYASGVDIDGEPWVNPPSMGADELVLGNAAGPLSMSITANYTNVVSGYPVVFTANNAGRITQSVWDFGDGTVLTNQPFVNHAWTTPGIYTVKLTGYNDSHPADVSTTIIVEVVSGAVHYVNVANPTPAPPYASWATAATSIQDAIDAGTVAGRLVLVTNGVYEVGGRSNAWGVSRVTITNAIRLESVNGPAVTTIVGRKTLTNEIGEVIGYEGGRCVYFGNDSILSGFTLTNGSSRKGAGVFCENSGVVILMRFQDETNCGRVSAWQDHAGLIHTS